VIKASAKTTALNTDTRGRIALRISVHEQNAIAPGCDYRCEIDGSGRFPDPAFLVGDGYRFSHGWR
jgi:hypothetical protein